MARLLFAIICISLIVSNINSAQPQCVDDNGKPVDWYVAYKLPLLNKEKDYLLRHGFAYMYITSENTKEWTLSEKSINDSRSLIGATLAPLFSESRLDFLYGLYNDDPPTSRVASTYGHTKGVVLANERGGVWLVHSAPKFPDQPQKGAKYAYPKSAIRYGQSFLCVSLPSSAMNVIGTQFTYNRPKFYATNTPDELKENYATLVAALKGDYVREAPWSHKRNFSTNSGIPFVSYAKSGRLGKELYADWLAPDLGTDLQVETWANGAGELPSDCHKKFHVMDITNIAFKLPLKTIQFKNSQDHSKWAVGTLRKIVCVGDINRMAAQLNRGGGTVCIENDDLWQRYSKAVSDVQPCPK